MARRQKGAHPLGVGVGVAESINPTVEDEYWRANYASRPYVAPGEDYETYAPANRYGWESYVPGQPLDDLEPEPRRGWEKSEWSEGLSWEKAKQAVRDAWHRIERAMPGDADRDGR